MDKQPHLFVGDDGEFIEPDTNIDPHQYKMYVEKLPKPMPAQLTTWDESRVIAWRGGGCLVFLLLISVVDVLRLLLFLTAL